MATRASAGDIFIRKGGDGRYVAVRALRLADKSTLVATTTYLDETRPRLDDPRLREILIQRRFSFRGRPATLWVSGRPSGEFELLGNIPVSDVEARIECNAYGGWDGRGAEALWEWRWLHDRPALEAEMREANRRLDAAIREQRSKPQKPKKMMDEDAFWSIISLLDWKQQGDDAKVLGPAVKKLAAKSKATICQFEERLALLLYQLDTRAHWKNTATDPSDEGEVSADWFLYARCVVVA